MPVPTLSLRRARGFTLIELIVVILILGILAAVATVGYSQFTERATNTAVQADLRQIAMLAMTEAASTGAQEFDSASLIAAINANTSITAVPGVEAAGTRWTTWGAEHAPTARGDFSFGFDNGPGTPLSSTSGTRLAIVTSTGTNEFSQLVSLGTAMTGAVTVEHGTTPADILGTEDAPPALPATPQAPANLTANIEPASGQVTVSWEPAAASAPVSSWRVYRNGLHIGVVPDATVLSFVDPTPLAPGNVATYSVAAVNEGGESAPSTDANAQAVPSAPDVPTTTSIAPTSAQVTWGEVPGATGYEVDAPGAVVTGTSATVPGTAQTTAQVRVRALNATGPSAWSAPLTVNFPAPPAVMRLTYNLAASGCADTTVILPLGGTSSGTVAWGDGASDTIVNGVRPTHKYAAKGVNQVTVTGTFTTFGASTAAEGMSDAACITSVDQWDKATGTTSMAYAFNTAKNLTAIPTDLDTSNVTNMTGMFRSASKFNQALPATFNTSNVTNMSYMFASATAYNKALPAAFSTAKVTNMSNMFYNTAVLNQPLPAAFDTSNVTDMSGMFQSASVFNQPLPAAFNTAKVTTMDSMFLYASAYNRALPAAFNTAKVTNMQSMFAGAAAYNQPLPAAFDTSNVQIFSGMFSGATVFNQPLTFNTAKATTMSAMFSGAAAYNQPLPASFSTANVTNMYGMFADATSYNQPLPAAFTTSNVFMMEAMFRGASKFNQDLSGWDVRNVDVDSHNDFDTGATAWVLPKPAFAS